MQPCLPLIVSLVLGQVEPAPGGAAEPGAAAPTAAPSGSASAPPAPAAAQPATAPPAAAVPSSAPTPPPPRPAPSTPAPTGSARSPAPSVAVQPTPATFVPAPPAAAPAAQPERTQVAAVALAFADALVAGDAAALSAAAAERFSFDGEARTGRAEVRRGFDALVQRRQGQPRPALLDLEVLPASEAVARLGAPPPRLAPLVAAQGAWVAIADVSGRPVVLFLVREGGRWAVAGLHG